MRRDEGGERFVIVVRLDGAGTVDACRHAAAPSRGAVHRGCPLRERSAFAIEIRAGERQVSITFGRPGAVVLK